MSPGTQTQKKEFLYTYLRQQPIWRSIRFWNAAFFDALQCERSLRPVVTREEVESNRLQAVSDELHYQENITFGQLGWDVCSMVVLYRIISIFFSAVVLYNFFSDRGRSKEQQDIAKFQ